MTILELSKAQCNNTDYNKTDISKTDPILFVPIRWKGQDCSASLIFYNKAILCLSNIDEQLRFSPFRDILNIRSL